MGCNRISRGDIDRTSGVAMIDKERIRELAYQRYELRRDLQWRLWETDKDDWYYAEHVAMAEESAKNFGVHSTTINRMEK